MQPERVVVAVSGDGNGQLLIERGRALAGDAGTLQAVHVSRSDAVAPLDRLEEQRLLVESMGGSWHSLVGDNEGRVIAAFAQTAEATTVVIGRQQRSRRRHPGRACAEPGSMFMSCKRRSTRGSAKPMRSLR